MVSVSLCPGCGGRGSYKVYNAYDPEFEEEVLCEYCDGDGVLAEPGFVPVRKGPRSDDEWAN